ncbi:hypothetical protein llap_4352 [Limosa lapponica baueri]|uniref:Uncharacterized protein n=1 Tax=Limosa lapponica baueri TaxID=1758121 RepID=A0A2I0UH11_LIMLA|nr:hypothetical protein llap_4352 [Limosa lapponica baueri]
METLLRGLAKEPSPEVPQLICKPRMKRLEHWDSRQASGSACIPRHPPWLSCQQRIADLVIHAGQTCSKRTQSTSQTRAGQTMGKILAPSEIYDKLSVDIASFLIALQCFWISMGSPRNTSSPLFPAIPALKLSWEAEAYKVETLDTTEKLAEVLALCLSAHSEKDSYVKCR